MSKAYVGGTLVMALLFSFQLNANQDGSVIYRKDKDQKEDMVVESSPTGPTIIAPKQRTPEPEAQPNPAHQTMADPDANRDRQVSSEDQFVDGVWTDGREDNSPYETMDPNEVEDVIRKDGGRSQGTLGGYDDDEYEL